MPHKINSLRAIGVLLTLVCLNICLSVPNYYDPRRTLSGSHYKEGELIVRFAPTAEGDEQSIAERNAILRSLGGGEVKHSYKLVPGLNLVKLPANVIVKDVVAKFNKAQGILYAEPNYELRPASTFPNDPRFEDLWGMHNTGQFGGTENADVNAPEAWDIETDASDIIVAVIDSGVDYTHDDLEDNMWVNEPELNGIPDHDDDGNDYKDDIYGYDFSTFGDKERDSDPMDELGHGTHCAGTIGARGNNGEGVTGVCWRVKIMALRFISLGFVPGEGWVWRGWTADAIACIEYAVDMGANVTSNSWGGDNFSQPLEEAIENAGAAGVLFVACAHNQDRDIEIQPMYPASYDLDNIISVMATDHDDVRSEWPWWNPPGSSNWGAISVDLAAPGTNILSCVPPAVRVVEYEAWDGTSMATPHVAGACALVWAVNPSLSHLEVKGIILSTVDKLEALDGFCVTGGRLNLNNAVLEAVEFPTDDELVGWWKFDEGEGTIAYDSAGDNDGTLTNMDPETDWVTGKIDGALDFDGDGDYVSLSPIVALLTDNVTISAWIRADDVPELGFIFSQFKQVGNNHYGYYFYLDGEDKLTFYLSGSWATSPDAISGGVWYHLAGTYDGSDLKIFVDGEQKDVDSTSGLTGCFHNAYIGYGLQEQQYFRGKIDDVRVYNYALDMFEIWDAMSGDAPRFRIKNNSCETVAWFDNFGNLFLKGALTTEVDPLEEDPAHDEFVVKDSSNVIVAIIDTTDGEMYIDGELHENQNMLLLSPEGFIIKNSNGDVVAYIDDSGPDTELGHLYLKGKLCENPD